MATINGTSGNDHLAGSSGTDILHGFAGNDFLDGRGGNDSLYGDSGQDRLRGGAGNDRLDGGSNSDTADYGNSPAGVTVNLAGGNARDGWAGTDTIVSIGNATGSAFDDLLVGNQNDNQLRGAGGNDLFSSAELPEGTGGNDTFDGGTGEDTAIVSDSGIADLAAGTLTYPSGQKIILTGMENLRAGSQSGGMVMLGDDQPNTLQSGFGDVLVDGRGGNDTLFAWGVYGDATLNGGDGNDVLRVEAGNDTLAGGRGDDLLIPGSGNNLLDGGDGSDTLSFRDRFNGVTIDLDKGESQHNGAVDRIVSIGHAIGSPGNDTITGNDNVNRLEGGPGHDRLTGLGAGDTFVFNNPAEGGDTIADFTPGSDKIAVARSGFSGGSFAYSSGDLTYDPDGNGPTAPVLIAHMPVVFSLQDIVVF